MGLGCVLAKGQEESLNWDLATAACWQEHEAHLVEVRTEAQHIFLSELVSLVDSEQETWWIGATDQNREGKWYWAHSLEPITYSQWGDGEPDNSGDIYHKQNCAMMNKSQSYNWNDEICRAPSFYVCQLSVVY